MQPRKPADPRSLEAAITAWNDRARQSTIPILSHVHSSIRTLRRVVELSRMYREVDPQAIPLDDDPVWPAPLDPVRALREIGSQLLELEEALDRASSEIAAAGERGESLCRNFTTLLSQIAPDTDAAAHPPEPNCDEDYSADNRLLAALVDAQQAEIAALQQTIDSLKSSQSGAQSETGSDRPAQPGAVEIQSVQEFIQNSPISAVPVSASYYHRILEAASSPEGHKILMGEILTISGIISERQLKNALAHQQDRRKRPLGTLLVDLGYTTEDAIAQVLSAQLGLPYVLLETAHVREGATDLVPVHLARRHACFPLSYDESSLTIAMANPLDLIALDDVQLASGKHLRPCVASRREIQLHIEQYYR